MLQASLRLWRVTSEKRNGKSFTPLLLSSHFKTKRHWITNYSVSSQAGSKYWKGLENQSRDSVFLKIKQDKEIPDCSSKPHRKTTNLQPKKQTQIKLLKNKKIKTKTRVKEQSAGNHIPIPMYRGKENAAWWGVEKGARDRYESDGLALPIILNP